MNNVNIYCILMPFNHKTAFSSFYLSVVCIICSDFPSNLAVDFSQNWIFPTFILKLKALLSLWTLLNRLKFLRDSLFAVSEQKLW